MLLLERICASDAFDVPTPYHYYYYYIVDVGKERGTLIDWPMVMQKQHPLLELLYCTLRTTGPVPADSRQ